MGAPVPVVLAKRLHCCHSVVMPVQITIRGVPEEVRDRLAARAARQHQSMQGFLREELERIAGQPSVEEWLEEVRERQAAEPTRVPASEILRAIDADRK
jgi:plasmid stability protein